jgi:hypothetical protein
MTCADSDGSLHVLHPRFALVYPLLNLGRRQIKLPTHLRNRCVALDDLQYHSRLSARRPALDVFVHSHAHRVTPQRLHLSRFLLGRYYARVSLFLTIKEREELPLGETRLHHRSQSNITYVVSEGIFLVSCDNVTENYKLTNTASLSTVPYKQTTANPEPRDASSPQK